MANFSPSIQFAKRWLSTPPAARRALLDELDDITALLDHRTALADFTFTHSNVDQVMSERLADTAVMPQTRLVHSIDTTSLTDDNSADLTDTDLAALEKRLQANLTAQIDDFLREHMQQLSGDLQAWLQSTIRNELAHYQRQKTNQ